MLTISPELALAFESGTLLRWKQEIAALLRQRHPTEAARFADDALEDWVRQAMESLRRIGGDKRGDIELFATTLFHVTEVTGDTRALADLIAIMGANTPYPAKIALLRKGFA